MNFIKSYSIDKKVCADLVKLFEDAKDLHVEGKVGLGKVDHRFKKSMELSFAPHSPHVSDYLKELGKCVDEYKQTYESLDLLTEWAITEPIKIQKYNPGDGYFSTHVERDSRRPFCDRLLVFMTYLNTVKEEGGTHFPYQDYTGQPVQGNTLIWPADFTHPHKGIVAPKETKYIITGWYNFTDDEKA